jgi:cytoskeletal protein CcmA (bactofilin family)
MLDREDRTIEGKWSEDLKTAGRIRISAAAIVKTGTIIGQDIVLEGTVEGGQIRAMRRLEIGAEAVFSEKAIRAVDLAIAPGATVRFKKPANYREVEVGGTLRADLAASGVVTIHPLGLLEGKFSGSHLVVEEGGGLKAEVELGPDRCGYR